MSRDNKFIKGALVLSVAGIIAKMISALYRIPLLQWVGTLGMGYYDTIYPIYSLLVAASLVGIPSTVSKLIAEDIVLKDYSKAHQTFKLSLVFVSILGVLGSGLLFILFFIMNQSGAWDDGYIYIISGIAIAPVFISVMGAIKGYFQGLGYMKPSAFAQIIENSTKVVVGLGLVLIFMKMQLSLHQVVSGAMIGASVGVIVATFYMIIEYYRKQKSILNVKHNIKMDYSKGYIREFAKTIISLAIPATLIAAAFSVMRGIDSITISSTLNSIGYPKEVAENIIGEMSATYTIVNLPLMISVAISASIIPAISYSNAQKNMEDVVLKLNQGIKFAMIIALPAATGIFLMAREILNLIYGLGMDFSGYIYMEYFGICLVMMVLSQTFSSVLQGITKQFLPLISLGVAALVKLMLNIILLRLHFLGQGVAIASIVFYGIFMTMNYIFIKKQIPHKFDYMSLLVKPLTASGAMGISIIAMLVILPYGKVNSLITIIIAIGVYVITILLFKGITREDLSFINDEHIIIKALTRLRLI